MLEFTQWTLTQFQLFILMAFRLSGIFLIAPFFNNPSFPIIMKIGLAMLVTLVVFPLVSMEGVFVPQSMGALAVSATVEFSLGAMIGFASTLVFAAIMLTGHLISQDMGITIANVIDPVSNSQTSIVSQFQVFYVTLLFIILNGPNYIIAVFYKSFQLVPLLGFQLSDNAINHISGTMMQSMFELAVKAAAPVMAGLLIATVAMGFIARTVPEMNIFILGFAIRVGIGLLTLMLAIDMFTYMFEVYLVNMFQDLETLLRMSG